MWTTHPQSKSLPAFQLGADGRLRAHHTEGATEGMDAVAIADRTGQDRVARTVDRWLLLAVDVQRVAVVGDLVRTVGSLDHAHTVGVDPRCRRRRAAGEHG